MPEYSVHVIITEEVDLDAATHLAHSESSGNNMPLFGNERHIAC